MSELVALVVDGAPLRIEYRWIEGPADAPLVVFLHEGLGSVAMWRDFPDRLCAAGGVRGLVYSRPGYGRSTPRPLAQRHAPDFMHAQARRVLPVLLDALDVPSGYWLFGHSDGGSIVLIHAASFPSRPAGAIVVAPHIVVEQRSIDSIAATKVAYETTDLRARLGRHHDDVESAFRGWNDIWLDPAFRTWTIEDLLADITCPLLAIQGIDDEYGTMAQIDGIAAARPGTRLVKLAVCGHSPHRDQPDAVIRETLAFIGSANHNPAHSTQHHHKSLIQEES